MRPSAGPELDTGTFRYAWIQGIGRLHWTVGKLVPLAVAVTPVAGAFTVLIAWYNTSLPGSGWIISHWYTGSNGKPLSQTAINQIIRAYPPRPRHH